MPTTVEPTTATVDHPSETDRHVVQRGDTVGWLCEFVRTVLQSTCNQTLAIQGAGGLANTLGVSHWALGKLQGDDLLLELHRSGGQPVGPVSTSLADERSILARAWKEGTQHHTREIAGDDRWDSALLDRGLHSAAIQSWNAGGRTCGIVLLGHDNPRVWQDAELALLGSLTQQLGGAVDRTAMRRELSRQRSLLDSLQGTMEAGMIIISPDGYITDVNAAAGEITGFEPSELVGRSLWSALLVSEDLAHVKRSFARLQDDTACERFESFVLTKVGQRRRISWSVARLAGDSHGEPAMVCTGIDITERCEAVERAVRAEEVSASAQQTLAELHAQITAGKEELLESHSGDRLPPGVDFERRARARRAYPYMQLIAPIYDDQRPSDEAFKMMKCYDISSRGFAFLMNEKPDFNNLIVQFGTAPTVVHLAAEIRHVTPKPDSDSPVYIVGCRYTGRVPAGNRAV